MAAMVLHPDKNLGNYLDEQNRAAVEK